MKLPAKALFAPVDCNCQPVGVAAGAELDEEELITVDKTGVVDSLDTVEALGVVCVMRVVDSAGVMEATGVSEALLLTSREVEDKLDDGVAEITEDVVAKISVEDGVAEISAEGGVPAGVVAVLKVVGTSLPGVDAEADVLAAELSLKIWVEDEAIMTDEGETLAEGVEVHPLLVSGVAAADERGVDREHLCLRP